jgi:hypothetical protein
MRKWNIKFQGPENYDSVNICEISETLGIPGVNTARVYLNVILLSPRSIKKLAHNNVVSHSSYETVVVICRFIVGQNFER